MKSVLIPILETFCPNNVYLQGTLADNTAYPDSFITFFTTTTQEDNFLDNQENRVLYHYSIIFYSNDPALVESKPPLIRAALKAAGFIPQGRGMDIPSDRISHTGWAMDFIYAENLNL